ncbi:NlpC/P60 family protein [Pediococcus argentinicus]|uniref:C40 family peptidase n=1 Tax=Pediococcus argentinicus TaxID=480391 RepID=UPI00338E3660
MISNSKSSKSKLLLAGVAGAGLLVAGGSQVATHADSVKVQKNDTVWALSQKFGVSIKSLETLNNVNSNSHLIFEGQNLEVPTAKKISKTDVQKAQFVKVTVKSGDSIAEIAKEHGVSVDSIIIANRLHSNLIKVGQTLLVPIAGTDAAQAKLPQVQQPVVQPVVEVQAPVEQVQEPVQVSQAPQSSAVSEAVQASSAASQAPAQSSAASEATQASSAASQAPAQSSAASEATQASSAASQAPAQSSAASEATQASSAASQAPAQSSAASEATQASSAASQAPAQSSAASEATQASSAASQAPAQSSAASEATQASSAASQAPAQSSAATKTPAQPSAVNHVAAPKPVVNHEASQAPAPKPVAQSATPKPVAKPVSTPEPVQNTNANAGSVTGYARQLANNTIPYVWGGKTPAGFDCSGFVSYVYKYAANKNIPSYTVAMENYVNAKPVSQAQAGDLLFWGNHGSTYHVAISLGGNQFAAAPQPGENVKVQTISSYFAPSFAGTVK